MKKLSLAIAAAATLAALSAAPAFAENTAAEQQYKLNKILNNHTVVAPKVRTRATTYTARPAPLNSYEAAKQRLFGNRPRRGR